MSTWGCLDCTAVYAVGGPGCPQCGSTRHEENRMPKITVHGGPSDEAGVPQRTGEPRPEIPEDESVLEDGPQDEVGDESQDEDRQYERWSFQDLRDEAKKRGLSAGGTTADLVLRLTEDDARQDED